MQGVATKPFLGKMIKLNFVLCGVNSHYLFFFNYFYWGRIDAEAEAPILWPPDVKNRLFGKDPDAGKDWRWEEKGITEDEMVRWHHQLDGHESEQAPGKPGVLQWGHKELDTTEWQNWVDL